MNQIFWMAFPKPAYEHFCWPTLTGCKIITYTLSGQNSVPSMQTPYNEPRSSSSILLLGVQIYELFSIKLNVLYIITNSKQLWGIFESVLIYLLMRKVCYELYDHNNMPITELNWCRSHESVLQTQEYFWQRLWYGDIKCSPW